jgi:hypothetical protein
MKNIFTQEFASKLILEGVILGCIVFGGQLFFENKYKPITAAEILKKENFLNAKRDIYAQAIDILNRSLANSSFIIGGKTSDTINQNIGGSYPTDLEINSCFSKLCIYSDDPEIPLTYCKLFNIQNTTIRPILEMSNFINLVRQDLGYGGPIIDTTGDRYKFIKTNRPKK